MRLYIKFFAIVLAAVSLQRCVLSNAPPSMYWYGLRCMYAHAMHDQQMVDRLVVEGGQIELWHDYTVNAAGGG
jgi:hypothetical protein